MFYAKHIFLPRNFIIFVYYSFLYFNKYKFGTLCILYQTFYFALKIIRCKLKLFTFFALIVKD